jgi:hypothetical protein
MNPMKIHLLSIVRIALWRDSFCTGGLGLNFGGLGGRGKRVFCAVMGRGSALLILAIRRALLARFFSARRFFSCFCGAMRLSRFIGCRLRIPRSFSSFSPAFFLFRPLNPYFYLTIYLLSLSKH